MTTYICKNCQHHFKDPITIYGSDDQVDVCPNCKSDNFEDKNRLSKAETKRLKNMIHRNNSYRKLGLEMFDHLSAMKHPERGPGHYGC